MEEYVISGEAIMMETATINLVSNPIRKSRLKRFYYKHGPAYLMLLVPIFFFSVLTIYPVLWAIKYVFYYYDGFRVSYSGMINFQRLMDDELYWASLWKQGIFAFKVVLELPLAFTLALILNGKLKGSNFFRSPFLMPYICSEWEFGGLP